MLQILPRVAALLPVLLCSTSLISAETAAAIAQFGDIPASAGIYEQWRLSAEISRPEIANPYTELEFKGAVTTPSGKQVQLTGFCSGSRPTGHTLELRYMPTELGKHSFQAQVSHGKSTATLEGSFQVVPSSAQGPIQVDPTHPFHFVQAGSGQHWFWNGTTTYQLLAWDKDTIASAVERLAKLGVNRIRVALAGRTAGGERWNEPLVQPTGQFAFKMEPWVAARPADLKNPGYDVTRFNQELFDKADFLLTECRAKNIVVSVIFYVDGRDEGVDPFGKANMGGPDEQRYYRYVIARLAHYPNLMWDVTNEYHLFRDEAWGNQMGTLIQAEDPYHHLISVHGHGAFPFRKEPWASFAMFQSWDEEGGYAFMLKNRQEQMATGKPMPQVNEEYGYEDHYPKGWGGDRTWPTRSADSRRRLAWEISMAGGYQTTGERANQGTGRAEDTGGGWVNGRGDDQMVMLHGYLRMKQFFTSFDWYELEPRPELAKSDVYVLAKPGHTYVAYLKGPGTAAITLEPGEYVGRWYNPRTGAWFQLGTIKQVQAGAWQAPAAADAGDWALLLERKPNS